MPTTVRQATPRDEALVSRVLSEAADWLIARNMSLWEPGELAADSISADVAAGLYFLAECDGVPAGTLRFQLSDPMFWPDVPDGEAAYVHRLAVRREFAGGTVSKVLLDWATERAASLGRQFLRLDCDANRPRLRAVYERFGFQYHSDRQVGRHLVARYQRRVGDDTHSESLMATAPSRYTLADYSPDWPAEFEAESARLCGLLGDELVAVHHIGSTSVLGLAAKPTIDLLPIVRHIARLDSKSVELSQAGYRAWGEYGLAGRRLFTKDRDGIRTHNVHFYGVGSREIERHLAFATYLRRHPEVCREYEALKRQAYARHPADIAAYCDFKDAWIKRVEPSAVQWYRQQGF